MSKTAEVPEAELDGAADFAVAADVGGPPLSEAITGGERCVDVGERRLDSDAVKDVRHGRVSRKWSRVICRYLLAFLVSIIGK